MKHIGSKIKELLIEKRVSAEELAHMIGKKSKESVYGYFRKQDINTKILRKISEVLDVPIEYFFDEIPKKPKIDRQKLGEVISEILLDVLDKYYIHYSYIEELSKEIHMNATKGKGLVNLRMKTENKIRKFGQKYAKLDKEISAEELNKYATILLDDMFENFGPFGDYMEIKENINKYFDEAGNGYLVRLLD